MFLSMHTRRRSDKETFVILLLPFVNREGFLPEKWGRKYHDLDTPLMTKRECKKVVQVLKLLLLHIPPILLTIIACQKLKAPCCISSSFLSLFWQSQAKPVVYVRRHKSTIFLLFRAVLSPGTPEEKKYFSPD